MMAVLQPKHVAMYLDHVLLWPDDGCFTAETSCLEVNYKILTNLLILYVVFLDGNKYHYIITPQRDGYY